MSNNQPVRPSKTNQTGDRIAIAEKAEVVGEDRRRGSCGSGVGQRSRDLDPHGRGVYVTRTQESRMSSDHHNNINQIRRDLEIHLVKKILSTVTSRVAILVWMKRTIFILAGRMNHGQVTENRQTDCLAHTPGEYWFHSRVRCERRTIRMHGGPWLCDTAGCVD